VTREESTLWAVGVNAGVDDSQSTLHHDQPPDLNDPSYQMGYRDGRASFEVVLGYNAIAHHLRAILVDLGLDPTTQHFSRTPERVAEVLRSYVNLDTDLNHVLAAGFEEEDVDHNEKVLVTQTNIPFMGLCAHHLLPFFGSAAVGYLPRERVVGLSKLTRLVYAAGHVAPSTQEHITNLIADTLFKSSLIKPAGVAVVTSALHGCMAVRGVEAPATKTLVSAIRGTFRDAPALRAEFMTLVMKSGGGFDG